MKHSSDWQADWAALRPEQRESILRRNDWLDTARADQIAPAGDWNTWLILAGRGWGKTRTGSEDVAWFGLTNPGSRIAVAAPTSADARDTCVEGNSGLLSCLPQSAVRTWNRSLGELILTNETRYKLFSADEPDRFRGPQHHRAWCDELAAWKYPDAWDQLMFGLRLGDHPQAVVTTTPRPTPLVRGLIKSASTRITRGNTFANAANLAPSALEEMRKRYEGTRLGRQELYAELLDDVVGALWTLATIGEPGDMPEMQRIVVAVDPSGASGKGDGDDIGIVVCGKGMDGRFYVIEDSTCNLSPDGWGRRATRKYAEHRADCIVVEKNFGGAMAEGVIKTADRNAKVKMVTASRGKAVRAEPVAALYEQGRVTHARGLSALEDQMCVAKGTLVETQRGQVPIELITTHDLVMTRNGFASIKWVGYTGQATRLIQIETQNSRIRVTECHPIYLPKTREFVSAKFVNPMDQLLESPRWGNSERRLHGAENGITGCNPVITEMPKESYYTAPLMKRMWGSFLTAVMSIIRTKTRQTIDLTTLSASSPRRTSLFISELGLIFHILNLWGAVKSAAMSPLRYGLNLQIDSAQTPVRNAVIESRRARISPAGIFHANHAEQLSQPPQKGSGCSAMPNARMITHVKSQSSEGDPVYNISVADGFLPEYYANGILTHNCKMTVSGFMGDGSPDRVDALVWGISELMDGSSYSLTGIF